MPRPDGRPGPGTGSAGRTLLPAVRLEAVLDGMLDGVAVLTAVDDPAGVVADFRVDYANPGFRRLFEQPDEPLVGRLICEQYPELRGSELFDRYVRVIETRQPLHLDGVRVRRQVTVKGQPPVGVFDVQVTPLAGAVVSSWRDVTSRVEAEAALRESEARFRLLAENAHDVITVSTPDGTYNYVSPACRSVLGWEPEDLIGHRRTEFLHPDDRALVDQRHQQIRPATQGVSSVHRFRRRDGRFTWVESMVKPIVDPNTGQIVELQAALRDVTAREQALAARRASEERFRIAIDALLDPFAVLSAARGPDGAVVDFRYELLNRAACEYLRRTSEQTVGRLLGEVSPDLRIGLFDEYVRVVQTGKPLVKETLEHEDVFGEHRLRRALDFRATRLGDGLAVTWHDITRRKQTEQELSLVRDELTQRAVELERLNRELTRSNEDLEQFGYVVSHDLQAPLRTVAGFVDLLLDEVGDADKPAIREYAEFILDGVDRMRRLIHDLLAYSRVNTRGARFAPADTAKVLARALASLQRSIDEAGAQVTCGDLPTVAVDPGQFEHLLQNLCDNALKFRRSGVPPRIRVAARRCDDGWEFTVADNGIGVDPRYQERVFGVFQRLHARGEYQGTGIGLAICKKIVERRGGQIWIESKLDQGATVHFTVPSRAPLRGDA